MIIVYFTDQSVRHWAVKLATDPSLADSAGKELRISSLWGGSGAPLGARTVSKSP